MGDLVTGKGLSDAVDGVDAVLHLASDPTHPAHDVVGARHLVDASAGAGVRHLMFLSIIGVDRIPTRYYRAKRAAEGIISDARIPWTVLRAAQFHSFADWLLQRASRLPGLMVVPASFKVQSVADEEMADRIVEALEAGPGGRPREFAGPEILRVEDAARLWLSARRLARAVVRVPVPGATGRAFRAGANTAPAADRGMETWSAWLRRRYRAG